MSSINEVKEEDSDFADKIAELCGQHYKESLCKKGQPQSGREWTLLAAVLQSEGNLIVTIHDT